MAANDPVFPQDRPDGQAGLARQGGLSKLELASMLMAALGGMSARQAVTTARALLKELEREQ